MWWKGFLFELHFVLQNQNKGNNFNSVTSFKIGGGHIYLLSLVLVSLPSAEPLGQVQSQMYSPVLNSH